MIRPNFPRIAKKIVRTCAAIKEDDTVVVMGRDDALSFCELIALECGKVGALPLVRIYSDNYTLRRFLDVPQEFLKKTPRHFKALLRETDAVISVGMDFQDPARFRRVPEEKLGAARIGSKPLSDVVYDRKRRWIGTGFPTRQQARVYGIRFASFHDMYWKAMDIDYRDLNKRCLKLRSRVEGEATARITSDKGTDLTLSLKGRHWVADDGVIGPEDIAAREPFLNLPSGEICAAPLEDSANGTAVFDFAFYRGHRIRDLQLRFKDGRAKAVRAAEGLKVFRNVIKNTHGDNDRIGELGIGMNPSVKRAVGYTLTDEKIIGTIHMAIGDNRMLGGRNNSDLHWDLIMVKPTLVIGETKVMDHGRYRV
ncbi:MAG: aminopeptidase [Nitrososphaeria archaeon]